MSALNRPRILALFATLLALSAAFVACGGDSDSPEAVLDDATFKGAESGNLDLSFSVLAKGGEGADIDIRLSGPFQDEGNGQPPRLSLALEANGDLADERVDFEGGLVLLPNKAYVRYDGVDYEVDPTTFSFVKSTLDEAQKGEGESSDLSSCQEAASELEIGEFVEDPKDESSEVDGKATTKVSGNVDVSELSDSLVALARLPSCESQLGSVEGPFSLLGENLETTASELEKAVKNARIEVDVGDDDIVRRAVARIVLEPESDLGPNRIDLDFEMTLAEVNEEQSIDPPAKSRPLNDLFLKLDINPIELLGLLEGGGEAGALGDLLGPGGSGGSGG